MQQFAKHPRRGRFAYLGDHLWADLNMEELLHNLLKTGVAGSLIALSEASDLGVYFGDGMLIL